MIKRFIWAALFWLFATAAYAIDITVEGEWSFTLTGNQNGAETALFTVYVPDGHRADVKVTGKYTTAYTESITTYLSKGEAILGGFDSRWDTSYDMSFKERGSFFLFASASPDYYSTSRGIKPYSNYYCRLSYVVSVKFVPLSDYYSGSLQAKVVVQDSGETLRFVYDDVDYSGQGKTWFAVAAAEAQSPDETPPWYDSHATVTKVVFDASFKAHRPKHCGNWFWNFKKLTTVKDLANLDTSEANSFSHMFALCSSLRSLDLSTFNTSKVTNMRNMFWHCKALAFLDLSSFSTANVANMIQMFDGCEALASLDLSSFNTANVTSMSSMFNGCEALGSLNLTSFNTENVTSMTSMFAHCSALEFVDVSSFNTAKVISMMEMFSYCRSLKSVDLSSFDTSSVTSMGWMFQECSALTKIYATERFVTSQVDRHTDVFSGCDALVGGWGTAYGDANPTGKTYARIDGGPNSDKPGYFTFKAPLPSGSYGIRFLPDGGTGDMAYMTCKTNAVYNLTKCAFMKDGKSFKGWACSNGKRYDDQVLVFRLAPADKWIEMLAVWE